MASAYRPNKRVLVVSDDDRLSRAIELNLSIPLGMAVVKLLAASSGRRGGCTGEQFDLLVVATSSPCSEPVLMLARASLVKSIGQVPLLIISDRPFQSDLEAKIVHLGFPFCPDELHDTVAGILQLS